MTTEIPCPDCGAPLLPGAPTCPGCGLRLVGPEAARLWQVRQQITALQGEADQLLRLLRAPLAAPAYGVPAGVGAPGTVPTGLYVPPGGLPAAGHPGPWQQRPPSRGITGQQVLLALGALLLLSAASFFLAVVWFAVGVAGQALIMAMLTALAVGGAALATRHRLPAAAETAAVIATGFVLLDLWAAHRLGLAGLDGLEADQYWTVAGLLGAGVLLAADRAMPRARGAEPLRRVWVLRPAAAAFVAISGWALLSALSGLAGPDSDELLTSALALGVAVLFALAGWAAYRMDGSPARLAPGRPTTAPTSDPTAARPTSALPPGGRSLPWSSVPLLVSGAFALALHLLIGLLAGFDPWTPAAVRYGAVALLLVVPVAVLALTARRVPAGSTGLGERAGDLRTAAVLWLAPVVAIVLYDLHRGVLTGVAVGIAALLVAAHLGVLRLPEGTWRDVAGAVLWVALPALTAVVLVLSEDGAASLRAVAADAPRVGEGPWLLPVVPAAAWALAAAVPAVAALRRRAGAGWLTLALVALTATWWIGLRGAEPVVVAVVSMVTYAGCLALGAVLAGRGPSQARGRVSAEAPALAFAALHAVVTAVAAADESSLLLGVALVAIGVLALVHAAVPGRLASGYVGTLVVTAGVSTLLEEAGTDLVEAHALTPTLLLATLGLVLWRRDPRTRTVLSMGPALLAGLGPSLLVGIAEGDTARLALVSLVAVAVLVLGLVRRWQAPVLAGAGALVLVAVTQGGPYLAYVSGWIILGFTGTVVLGIGVAWEQAIQAGRRSTAWFSHLK